MKEGPDIAQIGALIGDPARANMLAALMDGRARSESTRLNSSHKTVSRMPSSA